MVVKTQLLLITAFVSGFLLTLQFIVLQIIVRRSQPDSHPIWRTLYAVTTTAHRSDFSLFIIDPLIISVIQNGVVSRNQNGDKLPRSTDDPIDSYCQILCRGQKITQLATLAEFMDRFKVDKFISALEEKGYTVVTVYEELDPRNMLHDPMLLHIIVIDEKLSPADGHVILIAVFYDKLRYNWWRGDLSLNQVTERLLFRQGIRRADLKYKDASTLFSKVEVKAAIVDGMIVNVPGEGADAFLKPEEHLEFISCNRTRAKHFHEKYPESDEDRELNRLFRLKVKRILSTASQLLEKLKIPFWLSSGTLLGYYRQCDVIHYGNDVDIGMAIDDFREELIDVFTMNNLMLMHSFGRVNDSFELSFRDEEIKLDIFFFYREEDHAWNGGTSTSTGFKYKYAFPHFSLCWTDFLGLKMRIPCHSTLAYIEANYGKDWFHPVREWDWKTSPPNVSPNGQWDKDDWPQVIQSFQMPDKK